MKLTYVPLCLLAEVFASPAQLTSTSCVAKTNNFDDLTGGPLPPAQAEIGLYNGLFFEKFTVLSGAAPIPGVVPKSPINAAGLGLTQALTSVVQEILGDPLGLLTDGLPTITLFPFATIRALPGQSFDLSELYFGCKLNTQTPLAAPATQCVFSASGFNDKGQRVSEETFSYAPVSGGVLKADMDRKVFEGLKRMVNVTIALTAGGIGPIGAAVLAVDDVKTCVYGA